MNSNNMIRQGLVVQSEANRGSVREVAVINSKEGRQHVSLRPVRQSLELTCTPTRRLRWSADASCAKHVGQTTAPVPVGRRSFT